MQHITNSDEEDLIDSDDDESSEDELEGDDEDSDNTVDYDVGVDDDEQFQWTIEQQPGRQQLPFTGTPGMNIPVDAPDDPLQYFEIFMTDDIVEPSLPKQIVVMFSLLGNG